MLISIPSVHQILVGTHPKAHLDRTSSQTLRSWPACKHRFLTEKETFFDLLSAGFWSFETQSLNQTTLDPSFRPSFRLLNEYTTIASDSYLSFRSGFLRVKCNRTCSAFWFSSQMFDWEKRLQKFVLLILWTFFNFVDNSELFRIWSSEFELRCRRSALLKLSTENCGENFRNFHAQLAKHRRDFWGLRLWKFGKFLRQSEPFFILQISA